MSQYITFEDIQSNDTINTYLRRGNDVLGAKGYTEHSFVHAGRVANCAARILKTLEYDAHDIELAKIAGYLHDLGNVVNRINHEQSSALIAFTLLHDLGMPAEDIATIVSAIGSHDEGSGEPVSPVSAALILADKSDVRRSRVRSTDLANFDIHDRVNYAVTRSDVEIDREKGKIILNITIDQELCPLMDYFEIFIDRMIMCRRAALFLGMKFSLVINNTKLL